MMMMMIIRDDDDDQRWWWWSSSEMMMMIRDDDDDYYKVVFEMLTIQPRREKGTDKIGNGWNEDEDDRQHGQHHIYKFSYESSKVRVFNPLHRYQLLLLLLQLHLCYLKPTKFNLIIHLASCNADVTRTTFISWLANYSAGNENVLRALMCRHKPNINCFRWGFCEKFSPSLNQVCGKTKALENLALGHCMFWIRFVEGQRCLRIWPWVIAHLKTDII